MVYAVDGLMKEIRVALDRNRTSEQLFTAGDVDTLTLEEIISSKIADAARNVERDAPVLLLDSGKSFAGSSVTWQSHEGYGMGSIILPDDFMRLVCFSMSDWSRAVTDPIVETDPLYMMQKSRFPGIRGCPQKPVVAIVARPAGLVLEFYSCSSASVSIDTARYIPIPEITYNGTTGAEEIDICEKLKPAVIYHAAYLAAMSINDENLASKMLNISNELAKL